MKGFKLPPFGFQKLEITAGDKKDKNTQGSREHAEEFYEYLQTLRDDPDNYTVIRYEEVKPENVRRIGREENPMFLALDGERVVGSVQLIRGRYFGITRQPHVAEIAYSVAKELGERG